MSFSLTSLYETPATVAARSEEGAVRCIQLAARAYAAVDEVPDRIEDGVRELAHSLGFSADCSATGTGIFLTIAIGEKHWTEVIRVRPSGPDFQRAVALHRLLARIRSAELSPDEGADRLQQLLSWQPAGSRFPALTILASATLSASAGLLLDAQWPELLLAIALGGVVGGVLAFTGPRRHLEPLIPVVLAGVASAAAFGAEAFGLTGVRPVPVLIASLIILLPGWRLTVAMTELAQGHWTSGAGRFLAAITTLLLLIVGVVVGQQAVASTDGLVLTTFGTVPAWVRVCSPLLAGVAMTHLFRARRRDGMMITLMCVVTSLASFVAGRFLGPTASAFVGAFTAMAAGALIAKKRNLPYPVLQQPATVLLVPGSIGFLSLGSLVNRNVDTAIQTGFQMLFVALTLALGAMSAQVALRPLLSPRDDQP
ncbi:MAG: threonine/serine exporter family protein [Cytophagaceae bacterium]|nr:threonine/serine exporter family protein [Gemmatimonadaceae bacterium]